MLYLQVRSAVRHSARILVVGVCAIGVELVSYYGLSYLAESRAQQNAKYELSNLHSRLTEFQTKEQLAIARTKERSRLIELTLNAMEISKSSLGEYQRASLSSQIAQIAMAKIALPELRNSWIALLAIESRFDVKAKSPMGAQGIGQVTIGTAKDFALSCGLADGVSVEDLAEPVVNLTLSACIFSELYKGVGNSVTLSLVAYNAGRYSKSIKDLNALRAVNLETSNYVAKHSILLELLSTTK